MKQGIGKKELRVLLLGGAGAGKTALAVMFERKFFHKSYEPTIMAETHSREITVDGHQIQLDVIDCGSSQITDYNQYIKNIDGIVAVYDIISLPSFSKIEPLVKHCQQQKHCPCVLVGTKQDLEKERAIRIQDGTSLANDLGCPFLEITATSEEAVYGMFKLVAKLILDDADPKKVKKGGFKRLLKFKKKKDGTAAEVYEETEEEDSELPQSTTEAVNYNVARTASPVTVAPSPLSSSNSFSPSSFESNNNHINNNSNNNNNNYSNYSIISTSHNNSNNNSNVSNNINNSSSSSSNSNSNSNNYNNNSQDTKIINPSPVSSSSSTSASTPNSVRAFELIHYMTELKALLIQNKDYASIQTQLVNERETRLELEMKVLNLQKELQAYKLKFGEL